jgi:plasmid segregation protein ParM
LLKNAHSKRIEYAYKKKGAAFIMLIAIDHGNKQIKTRHQIFTSGLLESDTRPPFGDNILHYRGKYYALTEHRIPYMRDKTVDERFFILSLFAIAAEINAANLYAPDKTITADVCIGLPPLHYGAQCERFEAYFKNRGAIRFIYNGKPYSVQIHNVVCYPQAFSAAMTVVDKIKQYPKVTVIDMGGYTADYVQIKKGRPDFNICDSLEHGVILLYNGIIKKVNADLDILLEESDIDAIIKRRPSDFPAQAKKIVYAKSAEFINELAGMLRERMIDLRTGLSVFVGGGSVLPRRYITGCEKIGNPLFVEDIAANVKGYELLYQIG